MSHLIVKLGDLAVGDLRLRSGDSWEFRFRDDYLDLHPRPVLGQFFEDDLKRAHRANLRLPPFFSNLLPEGALRELVARQSDFNEQREALLLEALGGDLPGAVIVERGDGGNVEGDMEPAPLPAPVQNREPRLKFSLAGVQLKFSVLRQDDRLTLPATGQGGDWIVKPPSLLYPGVPANEFSMLGWAVAAGIDVPEHRLVPLSEIDGLPEGLVFGEHEALAIRRYDRNQGERIHQEDFAQVLGLYPDAKYDEFNYETIGNIIHAVAGPEALIDYARRLSFVILSGNGDAHHKNWSLLYPDGRRASLTPAYDLVFTRAYVDNDDLALRLSRSRRFADVTIESFRRLARKCGFDEVRLAEVVGEAVEKIRRTWAEIAPDMPMAAESKVKLARHLDSVRL
jgi:serine/threonine-protein kinase HipA